MLSRFLSFYTQPKPTNIFTLVLGPFSLHYITFPAEQWCKYNIFTNWIKSVILWIKQRTIDLKCYFQRYNYSRRTLNIIFVFLPSFKNFTFCSCATVLRRCYIIKKCLTKAKRNHHKAYWKFRWWMIPFLSSWNWAGYNNA